MEGQQPVIMKDNGLPSPDFKAAGMIILLFILAMTFLLRLFPFEHRVVQAETETVFQKSEETIESLPILTLASVSPPSTHLLRPPKKEKKTDADGYQFPVFRGKKGEEKFHPIIHEAAERHDVDPALVKAIIMAESSYDPSAVSRRGAVGLMQLMPATAESLGVVNRFNPEQNIQGGVKYIKQLIDRLDGDLKLAIAAYNAGLSPVLRHKGIPPYKATRYYVGKVLHYYQYYRMQDDAQASRDGEKRSKKTSPGDLDKV